MNWIKSLLGTRDAEPSQPTEGGNTPEVDPLHLAACVLLLDVAHADGEFADAERRHIETALERHFSLTSQATRRLLELAEIERRKSVDYFRFTSQLQRAYDVGQKMLLAELMWGVVLADGKVSDDEQYVTRKISNLLDLEPGYLASAKAAAKRRLG